MTRPILTTENICKRYGKVTVVDGVNFDVRPGEIHALLGANGAGKSTLCKMIAGLTDVSSGRMELNGRSYAPANKQSAERAGVQIIQQELNLIPTLSVAENLFFNRLPSRMGILRQRDLRQRSRKALDQFGLEDVNPDALLGSLGVGRQQMIEIASSLDQQCEVLILDEPTAALSGTETSLLFQKLDALRESGVAMIYISHRLDEVKEIADRITVLRDGKHVSTQSTTEVTTDEMVGLMSGEESEESALSHRFVSHVKDETAFKVSKICRAMVREVSFSVRKGERFGIAGLVGSGRTELLRAIFGADVAESGTVAVGNGSDCRFRDPAQAVRGGIAMVTEDRKESGLLLPKSIRVNTTLSSLAERFSLWGTIQRAKEAESTERLCRELETRCVGIQQIVGTLSGGNQQKVVIAKWLCRGAEVFLFDEPTRGIDVAARRRIYSLMDSLASKGKAMVIVSSDLDELFENCDRIAVLSSGRMVRIFERGKWSEDEILQASFEYQRN